MREVGTTTNAENLATLLSFLSGDCNRALDAIFRLDDLGGLASENAGNGVERIKHVLAKGQTDRSSARRYPAWISFQDALASLRTVNQPTELTWDQLEVAVYAIEECVLRFVAKQDSQSEPIRSVSKAALLRLTNTVSAR